MENLRIITDWFTQSRTLPISLSSEHKSENVVSRTSCDSLQNIPEKIHNDSKNIFESLRIITNNDNNSVNKDINYEDCAKKYMEISDKIETILNKIALKTNELEQAEKIKNELINSNNDSLSFKELNKEKNACIQQTKEILKENRIFSDFSFSPKQSRYTNNCNILEKCNSRIRSISESLQKKTDLDFLLYTEKDLKSELEDYEYIINNLKRQSAKIHPFFKNNIDSLWDFNQLSSKYDFINRHHKEEITSYLILRKNINTVFAESQIALSNSTNQKKELIREYWVIAEKVENLTREYIERQPLFEKAVKEILKAYDSHKNSNDLVENMVAEERIMQEQQQSYLASP